MIAFFTHLDPTGLVFVLGLFALVSTFLSGVCLLLFIRNSSSQKELWREMKALNQHIDLLRARIQEPPQAAGNSMGKTEFKSRLERHSELERQVPEKFRHVAQLERSGLGVGDIAEIFEVSQQEAEQMLSLARAAQEPGRSQPD